MNLEKWAQFEQSEYLGHLPNTLRNLRLKNWHYWSVKTPDIFIASALIQLHYLNKMFFYIYDISSKKLIEKGSMSLGKRGLNITPELSSWKKGHSFQRITQQQHLDFSLDKGHIQGALLFHPTKRGRDFELLHSFDSHQLKNQWAYTRKNALLFVEGEIQVGNTRYQASHSHSFGVMDWTKSWAPRVTQWKWVSFCGKDKTQSIEIGLNLSTDVYCDEKGRGKENVLWVGEEFFPLLDAKILPPQEKKKKSQEKWIIQAYGPGLNLELELTPLGTRKEYVNLGIVKGDYIQPFGYFNGQIQFENGRDIEIENIFGVAEEHFAKW